MHCIAIKEKLECSTDFYKKRKLHFFPGLFLSINKSGSVPYKDLPGGTPNPLKSARNSNCHCKAIQSTIILRFRFVGGWGHWSCRPLYNVDAQMGVQLYQVGCTSLGVRLPQKRQKPPKPIKNQRSQKMTEILFACTQNPI